MTQKLPDVTGQAFCSPSLSTSNSSWPIRGQYPGHMITLGQSEASIQVTWSLSQRPECSVSLDGACNTLWVSDFDLGLVEIFCKKNDWCFNGQPKKYGHLNSIRNLILKFKKSFSSAKYSCGGQWVTNHKLSPVPLCAGCGGQRGIKYT